MGKNNEFVIAEKHFLEAIKLKKEIVPSIYYTNLGENVIYNNDDTTIYLILTVVSGQSP